MRRSRHWPRSTPISISTIFSQLACLGVYMKLQTLKDAVRFGCREGFIQGPGGMGRKIVQHDPDLVGIWIVDIGQIAHAGSKILRGSLICYLHIPPRSVRIEEHEQIGGAVMVRRYSQS